ncbi:MAG: hypothetical protein ACXABN_15215 [Candidatus Thorarchaeota archaeon]|jgi:membrane-bound metal-dependent hydrolase YbcI (DUF457 family)
MNTGEEFLDAEGKRFLRRHWRMAIVFAVLFSVVVAAAVYVLLWFLATAQATAFIPATLGQWSIGHVINFILHLIFWELLLVVSWTTTSDLLGTSPRSKLDAGCSSVDTYPMVQKTSRRRTGYRDQARQT